MAVKGASTAVRRCAPALKIELMPFLPHGGAHLDDGFAQLQKGTARALGAAVWRPFGKY